MGVMIAGADHKGPQLFYVDNDGNRLQGNLFSVGSGSTYAYGILDSYYKWDLTDEQAVQLGVRAISEATFNDSGSGGVVRVYHVHNKGWTKIIDAEDNSKLIWKFLESKRRPGTNSRQRQGRRGQTNLIRLEQIPSLC